jgi:hypothetical protein
MNYSVGMQRHYKILGGILLVALELLGCAAAECDELADQCAGCPATGNAIFARVSCETTVEAADEEACSERLADKTYEVFGCVAKEP